MTSQAPDPAGPYSRDLFLGGLTTLVQPRSGHRAGLDAALLQALVPADAVGQAIDLGTGAGTVALALAARVSGLRVVGVEREPDLIACARAALALRANVAFAGRVRFVEADVTARREAREALGLTENAADWVLMNPPYDAPGRVRQSPDAARRAAHVAEADTLARWCGSAAGLLKPGGHLGLIHRASALPEVLQALAGRFGGIRIVAVHPSAKAPASRILLRAVRGSRAAPQIMPSLILHGEGGSWTQQAEAILRGRGEVPT